MMKKLNKRGILVKKRSKKKNNSYEDEICGRCEQKPGIHDYKGYMLCSDCIEYKKERKKEKAAEIKLNSKEGKSVLFS